MRQVRKLWSVISLFAAANLWSACGQVDDVGSNLSANDPQDEPLLVVMGGNSSCRTDDNGRENSPYGMHLYAPAYDLLNHMQANLGVTPKFVISCYDSSPTISYSMTSQSDNVYEGDRAEFDLVIEREMTPGGPVFFAGHSYGGWLAMKSALVLAEKRPFSGLVTIDPISREHCRFDRPAGCRQSPQDITVPEREFINERTDEWVNLYQTRTWYLHASPYDEADSNEEIDASHTSIDAHTRTWEVIRELVEAHY